MIPRLRFPTSSNNSTSSSNTGLSLFGGITLGVGPSGASSENTAPTSSEGNSDSSDNELPQGWRLVSSRNTRKDYFLHIASGHTQWERPTDADSKRLESIPPKQNVTNVFSSGVSRMGAGLTSMLSQANNKLQTTLQNNVTSAPKSSISRSLDSREGQILVEIYENERLDSKLLPSDPKKFSDEKASPGFGYETIPEGNLSAGCVWTCDWEIDQNYTAVDKDGWTYAGDFVEIVRLFKADLSHASRHPNDAVRRRRWIRLQKQVTFPENCVVRDNADINSTLSGPIGEWEDEPNMEKPRNGDDLDGINDDPFLRTAQKQTTGFRVNMKFPHRGTKDNTKDYQSMNLTNIMWLVSSQDIISAPTDEIMREKTANLEERIKEATQKSLKMEKELRVDHERKLKEIVNHKKKLNALIAEYKKIQRENETLQASIDNHRTTVEALRKEATEKDILVNEEQRAINAEMAAANHALEEKAKALATARMRYKRDNKSLAAAVDNAKRRLEQHQSAKLNSRGEDSVQRELLEEMEKVKKIHAKLEAVRQHRLAVEEESKALFNMVVEKKADLKLKSKRKLEGALKEVDENIKSLKQEQASLTGKFAEKPEGDELKNLNARRNDIRAELGSLKERRTMLLAQKRKQEGID